ncbi:uncharacterized protein HD556DRAFT_1313719 [Suillus plorans]|uniref:Uncharacterized protein n=1 Tax=Suillus plorans TaxID=116603 RepID=A0A9P7ABQ3_9AGAM|nr:uncharacterized protein HD556DRAFT_1313719 [Suillus plorans]KAG1786167.1 hypothetical protein HD556DRAFT_1313719 [Suillus plorans]
MSRSEENKIWNGALAEVISYLQYGCAEILMTNAAIFETPVYLGLSTRSSEIPGSRIRGSTHYLEPAVTCRPSSKRAPYDTDFVWRKLENQVLSPLGAWLPFLVYEDGVVCDVLGPFKSNFLHLLARVHEDITVQRHPIQFPRLYWHTTVFVLTVDLSKPCAAATKSNPVAWTRSQDQKRALARQLFAYDDAARTGLFAVAVWE